MKKLRALLTSHSLAILILIAVLLLLAAQIDQAVPTAPADPSRAI
jgi:hypothetical protein